MPSAVTHIYKGYSTDCWLCCVLLLLGLRLYFLTLLKRECCEADNSSAQLEMDMPPRQTPPSVQPPFNSPFQQRVLRQTHLSWWNSKKIRSRTAAFKAGPTLLPIALSPRGKKKKYTFWANMTISSLFSKL